MRRLVRFTLVLYCALLLSATILLLQSRHQPSNTHWILLCKDASEWGHYTGTSQVVRLSPGGGRLHQVTAPRRVVTHLFDYRDEWVYFWQTPYADQAGLQTAGLYRIHRASLREEEVGWFFVGNVPIPQPGGAWLELDMRHRKMGLYLMERPNQPRTLLFELDQPNYVIATNMPQVFMIVGDWMYFNVVDRRSHIGEVFRVRVDGRDLTNLTAQIDTSLALKTTLVEADWLIVQDASPTHTLYHMRLDGSQFGPIVTGDTRMEWLLWLPKSRLMILRDHATHALMALRVDSPVPLWQVAEPVQAWYGTPSGNLVIRTTQQVILIRPDGTRHPLIDLSASRKFEFIMEQSNWLYYHDESPTNQTIIGRLNLVTGRHIQLVAGQFIEVPTLSPDGKWLLVSGVINDNNGFYRVMVDGSRTIRLTEDYHGLTFMGFGPPLDEKWSAAVLCFLAIGVIVLMNHRVWSWRRVKRGNL